jgi:prophage antirepressor-like protein
MEIVKAFNENNLHTQILIKGTINEPLFRASDIGEILEISNIRSNIQHFTNTERHVDTIDTSTGPKQVIFLTEKGLYKLLFKSRKPIAETFQNWVCEVIKEIRLNGVYDLQQQLEKQKTEMQLLEENKNKEIEEKMIKEKGLEREKVLLTKFSNSGNLIYIIRVKTYSNGEYVVKIGHSEYGVKARYDECRGKKFEECLLLDCFPVQKSRNFETFIHNHTKISCNNIKLDTHIKETELFLIGKNLTYSILLDIINKNIQKYNENNNTKEILELECQKLQLVDSINNSNSYIQEILNTNKILLEKMALLEKQNQEILIKLNSQQTKVVTGFNQQMPHLGPRLQQINPETLNLINVYESVTEAMNENKSIKRPSIMKSIEENTIYCGFRWLLVERNLDPNIIHDIKPTKETKVQNLGYIAKLDANKTEILNIYLDRKTAAQLNNYASPSALDNPVKNGTITNGYYYMLYNNCDDDLICAFEEKHGEPVLYKNGIGQFDMNNNFVREFVCKYDVIRELKMSDKTLAKSLTNNVPYNNFYYKELGSKLKYL